MTSVPVTLPDGSTGLTTLEIAPGAVVDGSLRAPLPAVSTSGTATVGPVVRGT